VPIFVKGDVAVLFIHIPKTGGTSIGDALIRSGWQRSFQASPQLEPDRFHLRRVSPQHYHAALLQETLRVARFDVRFAVVRHPIERFRSEYSMRRQDPALGDAAAVEEWADARLDRYPAEPTMLDNHLRPQHEFMLRQTAVYRLEDGLDAAVADLAGRLGVEIDVEIHRRKSNANYTDRLHSRDVQISPRLEDRLRDFYARDFRRFGYDG